MKSLNIALLFAALLATPAAHADDCPADDIFEKLACEQDLETKRLAIDTIKDQRSKLSGSSASSAPREQPSTGFPALIRVYGRPGDLIAQFSAGGSLVNVRSAGTVAGWSVNAISTNSVTLKKGREARVVMLTGNALPAPIQAGTPPLVEDNAVVLDLPLGPTPRQ